MRSKRSWSWKYEILQDAVFSSQENTLINCWMFREGDSGLKMAPQTLAERSASITMEGKLSIKSSARFLSQVQAEYWQIRPHSEDLLLENVPAYCRLLL